MEVDPTAAIQRVLDNPRSTVENVVGNDYFLQALKVEYKPLLNYVSRDQTIIEMCKWIFSEDKMSDPNYHKMSSSVIRVFTSSIPQVFMVFIESKTFADQCYSFLGSNDSANPQLCGFLYTILSQQIRWGRPKFFKLYQDVGNLLFARMRNLAIQELIVLVATRQSLNLFNDSRFILYLSTVATAQDADVSRPAITILLQLYDSLSDESPLLEEFFKPEIVANLFKVCCETTSPLVANDIAAVLTSLYALSCDLEPNLTKYEKYLRLTKDNITPLSVAFISVYNPSYLDIFQLYFLPNAHLNLHSYCSQLIMRLSFQEINSLVEETDFLEQLMSTYGTPQWCSHMVQISLVLARLTTECSALQFEKWENFVGANIVPLLRIIESEYGGSLISPDSENFEEEESTDSYDYDYYSSDDYEEDKSDDAEQDIGQDGEMDTSDSGSEPENANDQKE